MVHFILKKTGTYTDRIYFEWYIKEVKGVSLQYLWNYIVWMTVLLHVNTKIFLLTDIS